MFPFMPVAGQVFGTPRCRVIVTQLDAGGVKFQGNATMSDVAIHECGGHGANAVEVGAPEAIDEGDCGGCPASAVQPAGSAALAGVVVVGSGGGGVRAASAVAFTMSGCAVAGSVGTGVEVVNPGTLPRIMDTLVMAARSMGEQNPPATQATACFAVCSAVGSTRCVGVVTGCVCAGSVNAGFALQAAACGAPPTYANNVAHHGLVGVLLHGGHAACAEASGFAAYACDEVAIPSLYGQPGSYRCSEVRLSRMVAAAAPGGVAASGGMQCPTLVGTRCSYTLSESVLVGAPGGVGFLWNAFLEASLVFPRMLPPQAYYGFDADAAWGGNMRLANVTFVDGATIVGGSNPDSAAPLRVSGLRFSQGAGRYFGRDPSPAWRNDGDCGNNTDCTGPRSTLLIDEDGSLTGNVGAQVVGNDAGLLGGDGRCAYRGEWNAYVCRGTTFRMLYLESLDPDRMSRRLWPVRFVQRTGTSTVAGFMDHLWNGGWPSLLRTNRFGVPVEAAVTVEFTGTLPRRLRMETPGGSGGVVVEISYVRPELPQVSVNDADVARLTTPPTAASPHGAWYWDGARSVAVVTLQPGKPAAVATLTDLVMVSLDIIVTDAAFWAAPTDVFLTYIASALGAAPSDVVVVNTHPPTRRRHLSFSSGGIDIAWLAPGAPNATLHAMQRTMVSFFATHRDAAMPGGNLSTVTVRAVVRSYTSGPLCYGVECLCPETGVMQQEGVPCVKPTPVVTPPVGDEPFPTAAVASGIVIGVVVIGGLIAYGVWWRWSEQQPRTYRWLRRKVLRLKI